MISTLQPETPNSHLSFPERGLNCWIISDAKAGNETQCIGVAEALGARVTIKHVAPRGLARFLAPYGPVARRERFAAPSTPFAPPWPDIAIACGRLTTPYLRALRKVSGLSTYAVILLDPKTGPNTADLFWVPQHDKRRGPNVITTLTSPHRYSPLRLAQLRETVSPDIAALPQPRVAVLIGGPNGDYTYSIDDRARLTGLLRDIAALPVGLMITCSRRTPPEMVAAVDDATRGAERIFWRPGDDDNPYPAFLAHADAFLVTADSVNMVGEACATGKPVHVFVPGGGSPKFGRFHASLAAHGATRPIAHAAEILDTWHYAPLYSATTIAAEITRRYLRRRAVLGNLM